MFQQVMSSNKRMPATVQPLSQHLRVAGKAQLGFCFGGSEQVAKKLRFSADLSSQQDGVAQVNSV